MTETITSPQNEKLKLVRKLRQRKHRRRAGLFIAEGEDLLAAARAAGREPVELLSAAGSGIGGTEVEPALLDGVSELGSGTRVIGVWKSTEAAIAGPVCVYLHGVGDPANVGAIIRSARSLVEGTVVLGPGCADPHSPKALRASMGALFSQPLAFAGLEETPAPRVALVARGGEPLEAIDDLGGDMTLCLGAEREGVPASLIEKADKTVTIALRSGAESLNVAAAAAIAMARIASPAGLASRPGRAIGNDGSDG